MRTFTDWMIDLAGDRTQKAIRTIETVNIVTVIATGTNTYNYTMPVNGQLLWAHVKYTSVGTATQRWVRLGMLTPADVEIADWSAGIKQGANLVRHYPFMQGASREAGI